MDLKRALAPRRTAHAHCDIPCGIYDPAQARIEAESCYRIIEKYHASSDEVFRARCLIVKEERAELAKHHIDVLWSDYFKPEHLEKYPDLQDVCWKAAKQASLVKRTVDLEEAKKLLALIDRIDEILEGHQRPGRDPAAVRLTGVQPDRISAASSGAPPADSRPVIHAHPHHPDRRAADSPAPSPRSGQPARAGGAAAPPLLGVTCRHRRAEHGARARGRRLGAGGP